MNEKTKLHLYKFLYIHFFFTRFTMERLRLPANQMCMGMSPPGHPPLSGPASGPQPSPMASPTVMPLRYQHPPPPPPPPPPMPFVGFTFTLDELDMVLYGYAKCKMNEKYPGHALSGLRIGDLSHGKEVFYILVDHP